MFVMFNSKQTNGPYKWDKFNYDPNLGFHKKWDKNFAYLNFMASLQDPSCTTTGLFSLIVITVGCILDAYVNIKFFKLYMKIVETLWLVELKF